MLRKPLQLNCAFHDVRIVCRIGGPSPGWGGIRKAEMVRAEGSGLWC